MFEPFPTAMGIAVYFTMWWIVLFAVLPFGVKSQAESGDVVKGSEPGAPVATPLAWREVTPGLLPTQFTIANAMQRFDRVGDLFGGVLNKKQTLEKAIRNLEKVVRAN